MPVSAPLASSTGRTFRACNRGRRAMSSASSSMEIPALRRRTLDWLSTSLLKGILRDELSVILERAVVMVVISAAGGRKPLSRPTTRHGTCGLPLPLRALAQGPLGDRRAHLPGATDV